MYVSHHPEVGILMGCSHFSSTNLMLPKFQPVMADLVREGGGTLGLGGGFQGREGKV